MYATIKNFKDEETFNIIELVCDAIKMRDKTFSFGFDKEKKEIYIYEDEGNKNRLHKRCMWIIHKVDRHSTTVYDICPD